MTRLCGIYCITNKANNKRYIGQSISLKNRLYQHKYLLRKGQHYNKHLQSAFRKYGEDNFTFEILKECKKEELDTLEIEYINRYETTNADYGYNHEYGGTKGKRTLESKIKTRGKWHHAITPRAKTSYCFRNGIVELWNIKDKVIYDKIAFVCLPRQDINQQYDYDYNLKTGRNPDDYIVTVKEKHNEKFNIDVPDYYGKLQ